LFFGQCFLAQINKRGAESQILHRVNYKL